MSASASHGRIGAAIEMSQIRHLPSTVPHRGFDPFPTDPHRWLNTAGSGGVDDTDRAPSIHTNPTTSAAASCYSVTGWIEEHPS
uniref:Uncharacterized protein n=2 Tax=Oryza TaxID=4527 RepID=A0A0E0QNA7_ORYRU